MIEEPTILDKGKIVYYLYAEKVIVKVGISQWVGYNQYDNWNRQGITQFKNILLKSKPDEYATPVDQMSLAVQCGIKGTSTRAPEL